MNRRLATIASIAGLACSATLVLVACGSDETSESAATSATAGTAAATSADTDPAADDPAADDIAITGAWARTSPSMASAGAAYFTVTSTAGDRLTGVSVDASIAAAAEMHETVAADAADDASTDTAMGGMGDGAMVMQPVDGVDLAAGVPLAFEPGGYHVMLMDLAEPLASGHTFTLTLTFEQAGTRAVQVVVADEAP